MSESIQENNKRGSAGKPTEANFSQFLAGLAIQTMMHLGLMSNPLTNKTEIDLANAKYSIDLLGILQEKTRGNLSAEEEEYFQSLLADLRLRYVQAVENRKQKTATTAPSRNDDDNADADGE